MTTKEQLEKNITVTYPCGCRAVPNHEYGVVDVYTCAHCDESSRREMADVQRRRYARAGVEA